MSRDLIAGIGSSTAPQMPSVDIAERQKEAAEVMFADVLSMGTTIREDGFSTGETDEFALTNDMDSVDARKEKPVDAYEKYKYKDKTIRKETNETTTEQTEKVVAEVEEFSEAVTDVLAEELHVTKEEIEAAMEELGLTFMDLLDNSNLAKLAMKLTGAENVNQLLCDETFVNVLQQMNELGATLLQDVQMTSEELVNLHRTLDVPKFEDKGVRDVAELPVEDVVDEFTDGKEVLEEATTDVDEVLQNVVEKAESEQALGNAMADGEEAGFSESENEQNSSQYLKTSQGQFVSEMQNQETAGLQNVGAKDVFDGFNQVETVQVLPPQVTVADIMEQFVEHARMTASIDTTKFEMQLNPEHLGKLYVEIIENEGAIQAKIQTQNLVVKEALELQIADLKMNLNQAGVKVDSVEVTVASHEFERNLEQDANSQKQQESAQPKTNRHRNISLNSLDELSGLMTEEETLVAKMMAEQGNSIDFTA